MRSSRAGRLRVGRPNVRAGGAGVAGTTEARAQSADNPQTSTSPLPRPDKRALEHKRRGGARDRAAWDADGWGGAGNCPPCAWRKGPVRRRTAGGDTPPQR
ncbi:hypothetical protein GCM10010518_54380 [Kitasatospora cinereorecta]